MDSLFKIKNIDLEPLSSEFKSEYADWEFSCFEALVGYSNSEKILAFCCQSKKLSDLQKWREINSFIAAKYLRVCENNFERWNTYLLFVCAEEIPKNIQYEIENNKFSMRKIVAKDNIQSDFLNTYEIESIINERILSSNVKLTQMKSTSISKLQISDITNRLLDAQMIFDSSQVSRDNNRAKWLNTELERISGNEN